MTLDLRGPVAGDSNRPTPIAGTHQITLVKTWVQVSPLNAVKIPSMSALTEDGLEFGNSWFLGDAFGYGRGALFRFASAVAEAANFEIKDHNALVEFTEKLMELDTHGGTKLIAKAQVAMKNGQEVKNKHGHLIYEVEYSAPKKSRLDGV